MSENGKTMKNYLWGGMTNNIIIINATDTDPTQTADKQLS